MVEANSQKIRQVKEIQEKNIQQALMNGQKLDVLQDKSKLLKRRARLFADTNEKIKQKQLDQSHKWLFILVGAAFFSFISILFGVQGIYCLLNALSGALISYAIYETAHFFRHRETPEFTQGVKSDLVIEAVNQPSKLKTQKNKALKTARPIQAAFELSKKPQMPFSDPAVGGARNKISLGLKK